MHSSPLHSARKQFPRYLAISFLCHLFLLVWLGELLPTPPGKETRVALEIAPAPTPRQPFKPKRVKARPEPSPRVVASRPSPRPIPQERDFSYPVPVQEDVRSSMFKENLQGRKAPPSEPSSPKKAQAKNVPLEQRPPAAPKAVPEQKGFAIRTEELFAGRKRLADTPGKPQAMNFGQLLSNLERHLEVEKYGDVGYAGEGVLSFADNDFKSVWYGRIVKDKVENGWFPPYAARVLGLTGRTVVTFRIQHSGQITDIKLEDSSGNQSLDKAALFAVENAGPLPGLPSDYHYDTVGVIFSFWYNLRPPSQG